MIPDPLEGPEPLVRHEFIRLPDSTGLGDHTESGQAITVRFQEERGALVRSVVLDDDAPLAGGREAWAVPETLGEPRITPGSEVIVGRLRGGCALCALMAVGYKRRALDPEPIARPVGGPNRLLKASPHVDAPPRIREPARCHRADVAVTGARTAPAGLWPSRHVKSDVARLPVPEAVEAAPFVAGPTLGEVVHDRRA